METVLDYIIEDLEDEDVKNLAKMIDSVRKDGNKIFEVVPHYSGSRFSSYDKSGKKRPAYSEKSFGVKILVKDTMKYESFANVYTEKFSPVKWGKLLIYVIRTMVDTEEGKRFFSGLINDMETGFGPDDDKLGSLIRTVTELWSDELFKKARQMLGESVETEEKSRLNESEDVYEEDIKDWILEDSSKSVHKEVENLEYAILAHYKGSRFISVSNPDVEDVSYSSTRSKVSYSGTVFNQVKVSIPNSRLTGDEEIDADRILSKVPVARNSILKDVEWDCTSYQPNDVRTVIEFTLRAYFSRERDL